MKKRFYVLALVIGIGMFYGTVTHAEEMQGMEEQGMPQQGQQMQGMPGMSQGRPKMGMMGMMGMMHKDSIVATSDGGVVVMQGPRLIKYDASLTLVNEVEIPKGKKGPAPQEGDQTAGQEQMPAPAAEEAQ